MFYIKIDFWIRIEGCPEYGILAVDFRRKYGLPDNTTNETRIVYENNNEKLCREIESWLDRDADLLISETEDAEIGVCADDELYDLLKRDPKEDFITFSEYTVTPELAKAFHEDRAFVPEDELVKALIQRLISEAEKARAKRLKSTTTA